jgi:hypothetical protein
MTSSSRRRGLALGLVGALALTTPALAGPVVNTTGVKAAVQDGIVDVRWRRGGGAVAAGVVFGALAGAAIGAATAPAYGYYGYGYPAYYGYGYPAYAYTYPAYGAYTVQGPVVYGGPTFGYGYRNSFAYPYTCGHYGGYGRWDYSQC